MTNDSKTFLSTRHWNCPFDNCDGRFNFTENALIYSTEPFASAIGNHIINHLIEDGNK